MQIQLRRACLALVLALSVALSGLGLAPALAASPPVALPKNPNGLTAPVPQPSGVEELSGYFPQISCSPVLLPGVAKLRNLALATYRRGHDGGISRSCVQGGSSEHKEGRAWDWMLDVNNKANRRAAGDFLSWLTGRGPDGEVGYHARRLGVMYAIYNRRIWSAYRTGDGWRPYSGYSPHTDHIHLSFSWAGARGNTSFWTGKVAGPDYGRCSLFAGQPAVLRATRRAKPCPSPAALVKRSNRSSEQLGSRNTGSIKLAQSRLKIAQTGYFDTKMWKAVQRYQVQHDLPRTGVIDQPTWSSLVPRSTAWRATKGFGPVRAARYGIAHLSREVLRRHDTGRQVLMLQIALRVPVRDRNGYFGGRTAAAVRKFKGANGLRRNGLAGPMVWEKLADKR